MPVVRGPKEGWEVMMGELNNEIVYILIKNGVQSIFLNSTW